MAVSNAGDDVENLRAVLRQVDHEGTVAQQARIGRLSVERVADCVDDAGQLPLSCFQAEDAAPRIAGRALSFARKRRDAGVERIVEDRRVPLRGYAPAAQSQRRVE